jgi:hypothetical protein
MIEDHVMTPPLVEEIKVPKISLKEINAQVFQ